MYGEIDIIQSAKESFSYFETTKNFMDDLEGLADKLINKSGTTLYVDLGDVFMLQGKKNQANNEFKHALDELKKNPSLTYSLGNAFYQKAYYEWALNTYLIGRNLGCYPFYSWYLVSYCNCVI